MSGATTNYQISFSANVVPDADRGVLGTMARAQRLAQMLDWLERKPPCAACKKEHARANKPIRCDMCLGVDQLDG